MLRKVDVAVIGGGPGGSTLATFLRKFNPRLSVLVMEREKFPRDHIGESQLPIITGILGEMDVWDKVEAVGFPIKIGATYRWGSSKDLWNFEFLPGGRFDPAPRPGKLGGQRKLTAFQVDRSIYDKLLLDHARGMGATVMEETKVVEIGRDGDRVTGLKLENGDEVEARWYVDASGGSAILRKAMDVPVEVPTSLRNIAIYDYWQNAEWASTVGVGGTRILVMSLGYGWIWFIPLGPSRTSLGLVIPASYYKESGKTPRELYDKALAEDPLIQKLTRDATPEGKLTTTRDWSFVSERLFGENWFLVGECAGFADPILSAGMTLAHAGGKECAYTIMSEEKGEFEPGWAKQYYSENQIRRIRQHIKFADFWYSANAHFSELKEFTCSIAEDAGLTLEAEDAWQWLGTGGFVDDQAGGGGFAGYNLLSAHHFTEAFTGGSAEWKSGGMSRFDLDIEGAEKSWTASYVGGQITRYRCYIRNKKRLPLTEPFRWIVSAVRKEPSYRAISLEVEREVKAAGLPREVWVDRMRVTHDALEAMTLDGWLKASHDPNLPPAPKPTHSMVPTG